ncbi:hypothetical protein [Phocaeicola coprophilus]|jgi:hypothetical protein|uniref:hypothetical protein n=1 Tax=Phocaeicola coprophilus TaxID=387090 RepID=UPI00205F7289|nr:MAG TPA: hypothetical protein [Bacteriophage sp.]
MAKIDLYKKKYGIYGKVEMSVLIPVNKAKLRINFQDGIINAQGVVPASFTTSDPVVQTAIENHEMYLKGRIKLVKKYKIGEVETETSSQPSKSESPAPETPQDGSTVYEDVKNAQTAKEVLIREFNVPIIELQDKESIKSKAKELGVSFPNWK